MPPSPAAMTDAPLHQHLLYREVAGAVRVMKRTVVSAIAMVERLLVVTPRTIVRTTLHAPWEVVYGAVLRRRGRKAGDRRELRGVRDRAACRRRW